MHDAHDLDLTGLSARNLAILAAGVRGGDGDDPASGDAPVDAPPVEQPAPVENPPAQAPDAPAEGDENGENEDAGPVVPEDLTSTEAEALGALHGELGEKLAELREGAKSADDVAKIEQVVADRRRIKAELQRRVDEDKAIKQRLNDLDAELAEEDDALPELVGAGPRTAGVAPVAPSSRQVANARGAQTPRSQESAASTATPRPSAPLLAAVSSSGVPVGEEMSLMQMGEVFDRTKKSTARTIVASLQPYEETRDLAIEMLGRGSAEDNSRMIRETRDAWYAAQRGETLTPLQAAICGPFDIIRDIPDAFVTTEPVTGLFPSRPAGRLAWQFIQSVGLSDLDGSVALWTNTEQDAVDPTDPETWKQCLDVDCPTPVSIQAEAIVACLMWDITQEMSNPENIANMTNALNALRARIKEGRVLQRIDALSHKYTFAGSYGAAPTVIEALNRAVALAAWNDRMALDTYRVILPPTLSQALRIDLENRGFNTDGGGSVEEYVTSRVEGVGGTVTALDVALSGESAPVPALNPVADAADELPSIDGVHRIRLVDPGAAIYAETGALNVGTTRDSQLLRQNKTQYFAEEFLLLAKQGPQPWFSIDVTICTDGSRAGMVEPHGCAS